MADRTIVLTGGGSGGHIMPVLAVAAALKLADPSLKLVYVGQHGDRLADIPAQDKNIDKVYTIRAGKFRRYHGLGWRQSFDVKTLVLNVRDLAYIITGFLQSLRLMRAVRPAVIFTRGGFVSVPVALAGKLCGVPYITHDSDSTPSLANRMIAPWACVHAVALPAELYPYPPAKTVTTGVPIDEHYKPVTNSDRLANRQSVGLPANGKLLLITGGGNGAHALNQIIAINARALLARFSDLTIVHIAGRSLEQAVTAKYDGLLAVPNHRARVLVKGFVPDLYKYSAAADVIIARGGATNLAEFAAQAKACIIIPSPQLAWNVKNAQVLAERRAVVVLAEPQAQQQGRLVKTITELLANPQKRNELATTLQQYSYPDAAYQLASILIEQVERGSKRAAA